MPDGNVQLPAERPRVHTAKGGVRVYSWPPSLVVAPGEVLPWCLWLHPRGGRSLTALFSWSYEAATAGEGLRHR